MLRRLRATSNNSQAIEGLRSSLGLNMRLQVHVLRSGLFARKQCCLARAWSTLGTTLPTVKAHGVIPHCALPAHNDAALEYRKGKKVTFVRGIVKPFRCFSFGETCTEERCFASRKSRLRRVCMRSLQECMQHAKPYNLNTLNNLLHSNLMWYAPLVTLVPYIVFSIYYGITALAEWFVHCECR